jgi:diaminopimelate decarboxylase
MKTNTVSSPNIGIRPTSTRINAQGHLEIGGCDTVELANRFGTPLWIIDEETVRQSVLALTEGLRNYPSTRVLFAGKAFTCLAMYRLVHKLGIGVDVVSEGELHTAIKAEVPPELTYLHGNNKSSVEITTALEHDVNLIADSLMELRTIV